MDIAERKKAYAKKHYAENKQQYVDRAQRNTQKYKQWFADLKETLSCSWCDEDDSCCLEFHHLANDKDFHISNMRGRCSKERIKKEMSKCAVLCANCHRKVHAGKIDNALLVKLDII